MRRTGDAYLRPDLPALRAAMQRAGEFAGGLPTEDLAGLAPSLARHLTTCHDWFLFLANYIIFNEQRLADLRGK
jgi:hypothetical protein